jgi:ABC-2 type transport system ATP-binding protein
MKPFIELIEVSKMYDLGRGQSFNALRAVSLQIQRGEVISLLGLNGAGKTTLSSILATMHPPSSGQVLYNGVSVYDDLMAYRSQIGFCPQRPNVNPYLTIKDSLSFAGDLFGLTPAARDARVRQLMHDFELMPHAHRTIHNLSGGYKQRFMLARMLVHEPSFVILDEPTVALDAPVRQFVWQVIRQLRASGVTVLLTTHYLDEAEQLSDRVCFLHKGQVVRVDTPQNLKNDFSAHNLESAFLAFLEGVAHEQ